MVTQRKQINVQNHRSDNFIINFEHISFVILVSEPVNVC